MSKLTKLDRANIALGVLSNNSKFVKKHLMRSSIKLSRLLRHSDFDNDDVEYIKATIDMIDDCIHVLDDQEDFEEQEDEQ